MGDWGSWDCMSFSKSEVYLVVKLSGCYRFDCML